MLRTLDGEQSNEALSLFKEYQAFWSTGRLTHARYELAMLKILVHGTETTQ
jgi:hypothetical protein